MFRGSSFAKLRKFKNNLLHSLGLWKITLWFYLKVISIENAKLFTLLLKYLWYSVAELLRRLADEAQSTDSLAAYRQGPYSVFYWSKARLASFHFHDCYPLSEETSLTLLLTKPMSRTIIIALSFCEGRRRCRGPAVQRTLQLFVVVWYLVTK